MIETNLIVNKHLKSILNRVSLAATRCARVHLQRSIRQHHFVLPQKLPGRCMIIIIWLGIFVALFVRSCFSVALYGHEFVAQRGDGKFYSHLQSFRDKPHPTAFSTLPSINKPTRVLINATHFDIYRYLFTISCAPNMNMLLLQRLQTNQIPFLARLQRLHHLVITEN